MRNFVKCFLEIEKDGVCLYSIIDIVCKIVYELDKLDVPPPPLIIGIYYNLVIRFISGSNVPRNNNCEVDILQCSWKTKHLCRIQDNLQFNSSP